MTDPHDIDLHARWMRLAIAQAQLALQLDEVPIGCVIINNRTQRIVGQGHNRRHTDHDPTAHAEIIALREAGRSQGDWRLNECTLYATLEPCPMCAGAIVNARIASVVYGCADPKAGAVRTLMRLCDDDRLNHRAQIIAGVLGDDCAALLKSFFYEQRKVGKK